jgi:hypothetical protein
VANRISAGQLAQMYDTEDLGAGTSDLTAADLSIPFLAILQKGSDQVDENGPQKIEGAKPGMFFNTVTKTIADGKKGIRFLAVDHRHEFIEWIPRDQGGGFVGRYAINDPYILAAKKRKVAAENTDFGSLTTEDGNDLKETFTVTGLILGESDEDIPEPVMISFASTQIRGYRDWMTSAFVKINVDGHAVPLPLYAHVFRLRSEFQENKLGSWMGWQIRFDTETGGAEQCRIDKTNPLYKQAKELRAAVLAGNVTGDYDSAARSGTGDGTVGADEKDIEAAAREL